MNLEEEGKGGKFLSGGQDEPCGEVKSLKNFGQSRVDWGEANF